MMRSDEHRQRIGQRIADLRKQMEWTDELGIHRTGMTQAELAERAGLQRSHVVRLEAGRYGATVDVLSAIASVLGMTLDFVCND